VNDAGDPAKNAGAFDGSTMNRLYTQTSPAGSEKWKSATRERPCPKCLKANRCRIAPDGHAGICWRSGTSEVWHDGAINGNGNGTSYIGKAHRKPTRKSVSRGFASAAEAIADVACTIEGATLAKSWIYYNSAGAEWMAVARFNVGDDKEFRPVHVVDGVWYRGDPEGLLPLYGLNQIPAQGTIYVCEGEKATDAARELGLAAVTSSHGSSAAAKTDWTPLEKLDVVILPDNDTPGDKYARDVTKILVKHGARVKVVNLPGIPDGGDIVEFIDAGGTREIVEELTEAARFIDAADVIGGPVLVCMADVEARQIEWLWQGRIPRGRITLLVGRPGEGKSFFTVDAAARVTTGTPWPDGSRCPKGAVLFISAEDDPGDTIRPRLDAHHADVRRVHLLATVRRIGDDGQHAEVMFTLADVAALETALKAHPDIVLIVIDPIGSFLGGGTDAHRDNEVRAVLAPVAKLAEKYGPAVLVVAHRRKSASSMADDTALGSRAFTGIARAVWHLSRDPMNRARRLLLPGKNNLAPEGDGMAFTIGGEPAAIRWERDPVTMSADDAMVAENEHEGPGRPAEEREDAEAWLRKELGDGVEHPVSAVKEAATSAGMAWRTVQRARVSIGAACHRTSFGGAYVWRLHVACQHARHGHLEEEIGTHGTHGDFENNNPHESLPISLPCHNSLSDGDGTLEDDYARAEREAIEEEGVSL
jgi:putative DNA primase/helicase